MILAGFGYWFLNNNEVSSNKEQSTFSTFSSSSTFTTPVKEPVVGPQRMIVVLIEFSDVRHEVSTNYIDEHLFKPLDNYYRWSSYDKMWIDWNFTSSWYTLSDARRKFDIGSWDFNEDDMNRFLVDAIEAADSEVNYSDFQYVAIFAAGKVWANANWPVEVPNNDGVKSFKVLVVSETFFRLDIGTFAHEFGHLLPSSYKPWGGGLPDLYSYEVANDESLQRTEPFVDGWDLMGESRLAPGFSAYSKLLLGWIDAKTLSLNSSDVYVEDLTPLDLSSGLRVIKIPVTSHTYYLVEVRRKAGYDGSLPGSGVMIYFVDDSKESGYGIVRVQDRNLLTASLDDAPFETGNSYENRTNHVYLFVVRKTGVNFTVAISGSPITSQVEEQTSYLESMRSEAEYVAVSTVTEDIPATIRFARMQFK